MSASIELVAVSTEAHVATVLLQRPPHNYVNAAALGALADALEALDADGNCRAVVLGSSGKSFCAGADLGDSPDPPALYREAMRLFRSRKPIVAAVQGAAVGAGVGLALVADFRIAAAQAWFSVNFNRLGFHPGFGLSFTLPRLVGPQQSARMFYTGERVGGEKALSIGLVDELVAESADVLARAQAFAVEIAASAPLAVQSTRETLRLTFADEVAAANARELRIQLPQMQTADFKEGVAAAARKRKPVFTGR